ncbi:MAG: rhamnose ABC transporter substrate-binding protein [Candidatus Roseilinea sp.]|nr:MAG: rhamnose ABC transporter substrate-binding protein [Candidatus Roseilinea sp.]
MKKALLTRSLSLLALTGLLLAACAAPPPAAQPAAPAQPQPLAESQLPAGWKAGIPKNAPDRKGKKLVIRDVPKLIGIGYFAATTKGMEEAAKELGNIDFKTDAPTEAKIEKQIEFIDNFITQGVDVILFASNDPVAIAPVLRKALDQGIIVVGYDADAQEDARQFFVNQATFEAIGQALIEDMVSQVGEDAEVAIVTSSLTAPNQNRWIEEMKKYASSKYPKLNIVTILPSEEDQQLAFKATQDIMKTYPNVKGVFGLSSVAFPGAADAVKQAGKCGQIAVVGLSTPNQMRPFVKEGCVKSVVLWNPIDLGYAAVYAARAIADGELKPGATSLKAGRLGELKINGSEILLGPPFIFNKDNIDNFDF